MAPTHLNSFPPIMLTPQIPKATTLGRLRMPHSAPHQINLSRAQFRLICSSKMTMNTIKEKEKISIEVGS
jgi:hypothetical protein